MLVRIWHGWTEPGQADDYEALLKSEIFPGILAKNVAGFRRIELYRRPLADEVEFVTIMWFANLEAVKAFAGEDYEAAYVPPKARAILKRFDSRSRHYERCERRVAEAAVTAP